MGDILNTVGDIMIHVGDIMSNVGVFSTVGDFILCPLSTSTVLNTPYDIHDIPSHVS